MERLDDAQWRRAVETLYASEEGPMYNIALRRTRSTAEAMELVHDAFIGLWKNRNSVSGAQSKSYLYTSLINLLNNRSRFLKLKRFVGLPEAGDSLADESGERKMMDREALARARQLLNAMPPATRDALLLSELGGFTNDEVAAMLGVPAGTVASRKNAARRLLAEGMPGKEWR